MAQRRRSRHYSRRHPDARRRRRRTALRLWPRPRLLRRGKRSEPGLRTFSPDLPDDEDHVLWRRGDRRMREQPQRCCDLNRLRCRLPAKLLTWESSISHLNTISGPPTQPLLQPGRYGAIGATWTDSRRSILLAAIWRGSSRARGGG